MFLQDINQVVLCFLEACKAKFVNAGIPVGLKFPDSIDSNKPENNLDKIKRFIYNI